MRSKCEKAGLLPSKFEHPTHGGIGDKYWILATLDEAAWRPHRAMLVIIGLSH